MSEEKAKIIGYTDPTSEQIQAVNGIKELEKDVGQVIKTLTASEGIDQRNMSIAITKFEEAFYRVVKAILKPQDPYR